MAEAGFPVATKADFPTRRRGEDEEEEERGRWGILAEVRRDRGMDLPAGKAEIQRVARMASRRFRRQMAAEAAPENIPAADEDIPAEDEDIPVEPGRRIREPRCH